MALIHSLSIFAAPVDLIGDEAPDFALHSLDHGNVRISEFRGEVVVLNFWSDWCGKCSRLMPALKTLHNDHADAELQVIAVDVDGAVDSARQLSADHALEFPVLLDTNQRVSRDYDLKRLPVTLLIDREGTIRFMQQGSGEEAEKTLAAEVALLLAE